MAYGMAYTSLSVKKQKIHMPRHMSSIPVLLCFTSEVIGKIEAYWNTNDIQNLNKRYMFTRDSQLMMSLHY